MLEEPGGCNKISVNTFFSGIELQIGVLEDEEHKK